MTKRRRGQHEAPPFVDLVTERAVLGAAMLYADHARACADEGLREPHFYRRAHQLVWRRVLDGLREGIGPELAYIYAQLRKHEEIDEVNPAYLSGLIDGVPRLVETGRSLARQLVERSVGRQALDFLQRRAQLLTTQPALLTEGFFTDCEQSLRALSAQLAGRRIPGHVTHISDVMNAVLEVLRSGAPEFIDTPWAGLNGMLGGGFAPGELVYLGARPGIGKSTAALEIARKAGRQGISSLIVSREMLTVALGARMLAQEASIDATRIRRHALSETDWHRADVAIGRLANLPIYLTHGAVDVDEIRRVVGIISDEGRLGLLIVDYLQLVNPPAGMRGERRFEVEAVSAALKALTLERNLPVLCLSSLSRPADGKAPTLSSLRESGNLEHDADTVVLLHRPKELETKTQCIVAKARNGRTGMVEFSFISEFLRFEEQLSLGAA